jgi:iron complex outermembrane receptor protein/outer membrane receptor for ferrienterochelin and colicins
MKNILLLSFLLIPAANLFAQEIKDTVKVNTRDTTKHTASKPFEGSSEVIVVSSSRTNSRIEDLPTKVEVLGAEEMHEENGIKPGNIASLLGDIAGIQIQQTNAATGNADMRIQGLQGKYTQLLRDGMPLFGGYSGSFSILQIPPLDLQQVELVKGSSSTLYGGGAIAGMLNLVSKKPKLGSPERSFTLNRSTLKENNLNFFFSGRNKQAGYTFFAGGTQQDAVDVNKDGFSDVPQVKSVFVHPRVFLYGGDKSTVILGYTFSYEDRKGGDMKVLDKTVTPQNQFFIQNKSLRNVADIIWEQRLANQAQLTAKASTSFFSRDVTTNVFGMKGNQFTWYSEVAYAQKKGHHNYVMGVNFNGDDFKKQQPDSSLVPNETTHTLGFFAQDDWKFANGFTLQSGVRADVSNRYGTFVLPRLSLMYKASRYVTMRLGGGLGYKTPTLFNAELDERDYRYLSGYTAGIEAERSAGANFDVNYKQQFGEWNLTFNQSFFYNRINHPLLLNSTGTSPAILYYRNAAAPIETTGFETYVQAREDQLEIYLGYVYTDAKRKYNLAHTNLPLIARHKLATVIAYEFSEKFRAGFETAYTGVQYLDNGQTTTPYVFAAAMMRYNIGKASLVLNCENLFDYRQNKNNVVVFPPYTNPSFPEIWAPMDGRVVNLSLYVKF